MQVGVEKDLQVKANIVHAGTGWGGTAVMLVGRATEVRVW